MFRFILNEVNLTDDDNTELRIADYYNWKPPVELGNEHRNPDIPLDDIVDSAKEKAEEENDDNKGVWI